MHEPWLEDQARIEKKLATLKTDAERIEFLLCELRAEKTINAEGRVRIRKPAPARGRNAKNIAKILRVGKRRYAEAKAKGIDMSVLPPESKIRKRVEADWNRRINPPAPKGSPGNVASAAIRKQAARDRLDAVKQMLKDNPKLKPAAIVAKFGCSSKTAGRDLKAAKK